MTEFTVTGMTCAACQARIEKAVKSVDGVKSVTVSLLTNTMTVDSTASEREIIAAVEKAGYGAQRRGTAQRSLTHSEKLRLDEDSLKDRETPRLLRRLVISAAFLAVLMYVTMGHNMAHFPLPRFLDGNFLGLALLQALLSVTVMIINRAFFISGFKALLHRTPNMDTLVALGSSVSFAWSVFVFFKMTVTVSGGALKSELSEIYMKSLYFESAAMIPTLITVGKMLEAFSKGKTTNALKNLISLVPKTATVERNGKVVEVEIDEVAVGDIFVVKPAQAIPVDGVIVEGLTAVDESAFTGESVPVDKSVGDTVSAATLNQSGYIKARATRVGEDTGFAKIVQTVRDAVATKAPIARIADRVSGVFVPTVIAISLAVATAYLALGKGAPYALERAISVLVVSCPCALGLATPVAITVGNGVGARNGILFKNSESLENIGRVDTVAFDKTGTVTRGIPEVTDIVPFAAEKNELLKLAVSLEAKSEHPLARAIVKKCEDENITPKATEDFSAVLGNGITAVIDGKAAHAGSLKYIATVIDIQDGVKSHAQALASQGKTPIFFEVGGALSGIIAVADTIKASSANAVKELTNMGVEAVMLTGDNKRTANAIGESVGFKKIMSELLPDEKEKIVRTLAESGKVAVVGDGINDAPALARADVGIAIGTGTDVAVESADVVLMNSQLTGVSAAIRLGRATLRNIYENLFWAFAYNIILIPLAAGLIRGVEMNPMWSAAAMSLSSFTVCMNALRLNLFKLHSTKYDRPRKQRKHDKPKKDDDIMTKTMKIEGMMCQHCEMTVKKALEAIDGVESATVSHESGTAVVTLSGDVSDGVLEAAVEEKGYVNVRM